MRHVISRCAHCQCTYYYQASGWNEPDFDDSTYCHSCKKAIVETLAKIPVRFKKVLEKTDDIDVITILKWEKEDRDNAAKNNRIYARRIAMPLFNLETGEVSRQGYVKGRGKLSGRTYYYQYWPDKEDQAIIEIEMEKDLITGQTKPWTYY